MRETKDQTSFLEDICLSLPREYGDTVMAPYTINTFYGMLYILSYLTWYEYQVVISDINRGALGGRSSQEPWSTYTYVHLVSRAGWSGK